MNKWPIRRRRRLLTALAICAAGCVGDVATAAAEEWSRFRGSNGSGAASAVSFPASWTEDDYLWKISLPGRGHSSPVGWGDRLFVTVGDQQTGATTLLALDAATGRTLWSVCFESDPHAMHAANSYASSTPAVDAERAYVLWASSESLQAAALDHNGREVWRRDLGPADYKHGFGSSPIVVGDSLIVANDHSGDSSVTALDAKTGVTRWRRRRRGGIESYATPLVLPTGDGKQQIVVCSSAEGIVGLSPADGSVQWSLADIYPARCVNSPIVAKGLILTGSGEGGNGKSLTAVRPPASDGDEATIAYELGKSLPQTPTPIAVDGLLFVWSDRGVVSCYDAADGALRWTKRIGGNYFGSPVAAGGKIYCIGADGETAAIAADDEYRLLGRSQLGEASHATPTIHQGKMFLRTESSIACLPADKSSRYDAGGAASRQEQD